MLDMDGRRGAGGALKDLKGFLPMQGVPVLFPTPKCSRHVQTHLIPGVPPVSEVSPTPGSLPQRELGWRRCGELRTRLHCRDVLASSAPQLQQPGPASRFRWRLEPYFQLQSAITQLRTSVLLLVRKSTDLVEAEVFKRRHG